MMLRQADLAGQFVVFEQVLYLSAQTCITNTKDANLFVYLHYLKLIQFVVFNKNKTNSHRGISEL